MVLSNVIVDVTIRRRPFVFGHSRALILYTAPCLSSGLSLSLTLVSSRRKVVIGLCATRILSGCNIRAIVSEVPLMYGIVAVVTGPELV